MKLLLEYVEANAPAYDNTISVSVGGYDDRSIMDAEFDNMADQIELITFGKVSRLF